MHDPRIGRFFAVDPLAPKYAEWSPYAFSGNQVIHTFELEGLEPEQRIDKNNNVIIENIGNLGAGTEGGGKGNTDWHYYIWIKNQSYETWEKLGKIDQPDGSQLNLPYNGKDVNVINVNFPKIITNSLFNNLQTSLKIEVPSSDLRVQSFTLNEIKYVANFKDGFFYWLLELRWW